jgi:hypothetical protein
MAVDHWQAPRRGRVSLLEQPDRRHAKEVRRVVSDRRQGVGRTQHVRRVYNDRRHAKEVCRVDNDRR